MNNCFKNISLITIFLSLFIQNTQTMLNNIAGTDSILHDKYMYLALPHGAIAWETGVVRRLYDFGQISPVYGQDKQGRKIIEKYEHPEQTSKLVRLIHVLFYRVPGSTAETDFGVTIQLAQDDPDLVVPLIAELIVQCGQLQELRTQFYAAVDYVRSLIAVINDAGWLPKLGKKVTQENLEQIINAVEKTPWNKNAGELFISRCKLIAQDLQQELGMEVVQKLEASRKVAENFFNLIVASAQNLRKLVKQTVVFKSGDVVESFIVGALDESDPNNPNALYPEYTVEMMLLAFIYKKYSANRTILKFFYDTLNKKMDGALLKEDLTQAWVQDNFKSVTKAEALALVSTILQPSNAAQMIDKHLAEFVYNAFQIRAFPAPVGYERVAYEYAAGKKTSRFSDCMDNAIRNVINLYAYDDEKNVYTLAALLTHTKLKQVHPDLAHFLKTFGDVNMASSPQAHQAWVRIVVNIPYAAYRQMVNPVTGDSVSVKSGKGYIAVPEQERTHQLVDWLAGQEYMLIANDQYDYELRASPKNIIVVLDHLLQLHLFDNAGGLAKEFMRPDFIKAYLPKVCAALQADCFMSTQEGADEHELGKDFDALDYTRTHIYTTITFAGFSCQFNTYAEHGEIVVSRSESGSIEEQNFVHRLQESVDFKGCPSLSLFITHIVWEYGKTSFAHTIDDQICLYLNLFATPVENTGLLGKIMKEAFSVVKNDMSVQVKERIKDLFIRLAERQPDQAIRMSMIIEIIALFVQKSDVHDLNIKNLIALATKGLVDAKAEVRDAALKLFFVLFEKGQALDEAQLIVRQLITNQDSSLRSIALGLLTLLVKMGYVIDFALDVAKQGASDPVIGVRRRALVLFTAFVEAGYGFASAMQAAIKSLFEQSKLIRDSAQALLKALLVKVPEQTRLIIQELLTDPDSKLDIDARSRLALLVK